VGVGKINIKYFLFRIVKGMTLDNKQKLIVEDI